MAAKAFILIETSVGKTKEATASLRQLEGVKSVDSVSGPYDLIIIAEAADRDAIYHLVTSKIRPIAGISRTVTCYCTGTVD